MPTHPINLAGEIFGSWLVLRMGPSKGKPGRKPRRYWVCRCQCGTEREVLGASLRSGQSVCCGCKGRLPLGRKHGLTGTKVYSIWVGIIARCLDPNHKSYLDYGGRGITVCERWLNSAKAFFEDMGHPPSDKHSINRLDNNQGYCKENCAWSTATEQARNRRNTIVIMFQGETKTLMEWAQTTGIAYRTLYQRLSVGWPVHLAFTLPTCHGKSVRRTRNLSNS